MESADHLRFLFGEPEDLDDALNSGWNVRELKRQKASCLYERLALSRDKVGIKRLAKEGQIIMRPEDLLKEPLVLEFLGLDEKTEYSESDLESALITHLEKFLLELGKGFLFEARQKRFTFDGDHYFLDLVFYNRLLRRKSLLAPHFRRMESTATVTPGWLVRSKRSRVRTPRQRWFWETGI